MYQNPNNRLKNQTCIVTGANSGIGRAIATAMAREGANVVVNYVSNEPATEAVLAEIKQMGGTAIGFRADVSQEEQVMAMFAETIQTFGTVDIMVNNAGLQRDAAFHEMTKRDWQQVIDVNLTGQFFCAREAIREYLRRGFRPEVSVALGKILCISSVHEVIPWAGHANYAASKGGVMLMMKSIAQEYGPKKIRINSIAPGAIRTPINRMAWETPEAENELLKLIPYLRIGETSDIGATAVWLASDESDYIHGTSIFVDGGMTLYPGFTTNG
ncbi:SDR family oxidoreductase [Spirosoma linguale]|uniref:Short-chain dehydrogenase/reductase SDR n=1 Tax=Spirosoma linguale (strain ATCC 33905 / DSM 74 / LMG 10896 / Claus 1) TaxID=504472 RepID=D2QGN0_SPILD|nr:short-chain dehydrogenase/reductase SDR [Spirosoma linguale DSM 74]